MPIRTRDWFRDPAATALTFTVTEPVLRLVSCLTTFRGALARITAEPPLGITVREMTA